MKRKLVKKKRKLVKNETKNSKTYGKHCKHWSTIRKLNKKIDKKDW